MLVLRNQKGQMTGKLQPDGWYVQRLKRQPHSFHKTRSLAIDLTHLSILQKEGAIGVRKVFMDTGEVFETTIDNFLSYGKVNQWTEVDGRQVFLSERYWDKEMDEAITSD